MMITDSMTGTIDTKNSSQTIVQNVFQISPFSLASRRSAFSPYRPSTVLTNLQRGNIQTQTSNEPVYRNVHQLAALGELFLCNLDHEIVNKVDEKGLTPVLWAASYGQLASLQTLHRYGADLHFKGPAGENALMLAASNGHLAVIRHLITMGLDINETDEDGNTALIYAAYGDHKTCVQELLNNNADITVENSNLDTVYSIAVKRDFHIVRELLEAYTLNLLNGNQ